MPAPSLKEYHGLITAWLRLLETKLARGDAVKLQSANEMSDKELGRKWLWVVSIAGGPLCFLGFPIILSVLQTFMPIVIMHCLWFLAKGAMGIVFIAFILAILVTVRKSDDDTE